MRDARDDLGDLMHVARLGLELEHARDRLLDALEYGAHLRDREPRHVDARAGLLVRLGRKAEGLARAARVALDRRRDLLHEPRRVGEPALLLGDVAREPRDGGRDALVPARQRLGAAREVLRGALHARRSGLHAVDQLAQARGHALEPAREIPGLVGKARLVIDHAQRAQIAVAHLVARGAQRLEGVAERARQDVTDRTARAERHGKRNPRRHVDAAAQEQRGDPHDRRSHDQRAHDELVRECNSHAEDYRCTARAS